MEYINIHKPYDTLPQWSGRSALRWNFGSPEWTPVENWLTGVDSGESSRKLTVRCKIQTHSGGKLKNWFTPVIQGIFPENSKSDELTFLQKSLTLRHFFRVEVVEIEKVWWHSYIRGDSELSEYQIRFSPSHTVFSEINIKLGQFQKI